MSINIILGFDFGLKRIGIAVGQTVTANARALMTVKAKQGMPQWLEINSLIKQWQPDALVVGVPFNMDGTEQLMTGKARIFVGQLQAQFNLPVYELDERLSTVAAREETFVHGGYRLLQQSDIDAVAAKLIAEQWLKTRI